MKTLNMVQSFSEHHYRLQKESELMMQEVLELRQTTMITVEKSQIRQTKQLFLVITGKRED